MSDYKEVVSAYETRILRSHGIRETQDDTNPHWRDYNREITALANELHQFKHNIPRLRDLDHQLREASYELARLERVTDASTRKWSKTAGWTGASGGAGLLGTLALDLPGLIIVVSLLLLAAAAASVAVKVRNGRAGTTEVTDARAYVDALKDEKARLMPRDVDDVIEDGWAA